MSNTIFLLQERIVAKRSQSRKRNSSQANLEENEPKRQKKHETPQFEQTQEVLRRNFTGLQQQPVSRLQTRSTRRQSLPRSEEISDLAELEFSEYLKLFIEPYAKFLIGRSDQFFVAYNYFATKDVFFKLEYYQKIYNLSKEDMVEILRTCGFNVGDDDANSNLPDISDEMDENDKLQMYVTQYFAYYKALVRSKPTEYSATVTLEQVEETFPWVKDMFDEAIMPKRKREITLLTRAGVPIAFV